MRIARDYIVNVTNVNKTETPRAAHVHGNVGGGSTGRVRGFPLLTSTCESMVKLCVICIQSIFTGLKSNVHVL